MKILLVEPFYERSILPIPLMKMSRFHKNVGDDVKYQLGSANFVSDFEPDQIMITSLFTWDYDVIIQTVGSYLRTFPKAKITLGGICATLHAKEIRQTFSQYQNFGVVTGLDDLYEKELPDYSLLKEETDYYVGFTTRGCCNKCAFCMVWRHEPLFIEYENWFAQIIDLDIYYKKKRILLLDNNFLNSSDKHFDSVIQGLNKVSRLKVDFNQSLDCRLFTRERGEKIASLNLEYLRFSFDWLKYDGEFQKAVLLARELGIKCDIRVDILYGFTDTPADFWYRLSECIRLGCSAIPMRYQNLMGKEKGDFIGKNWTREQLRNFRILANQFYAGGALYGEHEYFLKNMGKNADEFIKKISKGDKDGQRGLDQY